MRHWLVRTEPDVYSIDDLKRDKRTLWDCVRNYQARNFLREMTPGDLVLVYHSNADPTGVAGIAKVKKSAEPEEIQFDRKSEYFDPKATREAPRWFAPELSFVKKLPSLVTLPELRSERALANMLVLKRGMRLSVQPVTEREYETVLTLAEKGKGKKG